MLGKWPKSRHVVVRSMGVTPIVGQYSIPFDTLVEGSA